MKTKITHAQVKTLCHSLQARLLTLSKGQEQALYAVPRGGIPVAYLLDVLGNHRLVDSPEEADVIIDDIIDSGSTKNLYQARYPETPFLALIDKSDKASPYADKWVVFPWEKEGHSETEDDSIVGTLKARLVACNLPFAANDNISSILKPGELATLEDELRRRVQYMLEGLVIDVDNDHNTKGSAKRLAKMYLREVFKGRYLPPPVITDFPNIRKLDEMYVTGPITIRSACSHHFVPIMGKCWIGVIPGERVIGLSKFNRIIEWIAARPQIQEELIMQIADYLEKQIKPRGLGVILEATHTCMTWRGVREPMDAKMVNSVVRGVLRDKPNAKAEFMALVNR